MISKTLTGWQAQQDAGETSRRLEVHSESTTVGTFVKLVSTSPSPEEQVYALQLLNDGCKFAIDCNQNVWEFAVEISDLLERGVSRSLLRWLICRRLVEHRIESRICKGTRRQFLEAPNLVLTDHSCFILSSEGKQTLASLLQHYQSMISQPHRLDYSVMNDVPRETPIWCPNTRVLKITGKVVKHFKWPAPNQEMLIAAFAEMGWPDQIDDPLPKTDVCPKRRLHDTIKCLNRNQVNALIKFRGDGTGRAARWEIRLDGSPIEDE